MTTPINKTTQFNQQLTVTSENGDNTNYASFNGAIDQYGVPSVSCYISDNVIYRENVSNFRESWSNFQDEVFAEAEKFANSVKAVEQVTADEH